jgi:methyltransferase family protein
LRLKNGYPGLYYQFLSNVFLKRLHKIIIPFPNTSIIAFKWLKQRNIQADIIYIDGSHEEDEIYIDIKNYYQLIKKRGVIFGDDWDWASIRRAVRKFAKEKKLKIKLMGNKSFWSLNKK